MSAVELSKEEKILKAVYMALIAVIRDTTTDPRLKHPLSEKTQMTIRDALDLITARQAELSEAAGRPMKARPHYVDEPRSSVAVNLERGPSTRGDDKKH